MHTYTFRLKAGQDVRQEIESFVKDRQISAGVLLSLVGSLKVACLRLNGSREITTGGPFEIVSATGTLGTDGLHIHLSLANTDGNVYGGHLKNGCLVHTTAEVVIGHIIEEEFRRVPDADTGHRELEVKSPSSS
ncbi:PPC domain-containing DNA-binding protein [Patescibacteria group bacterium]